jgi:hypothetical protein
MTEPTRQQVIRLAVKFVKKYATPVEDAMVSSLEEYDTGYNLTRDGWDQLQKDIEEAVING